MSYPLIAEIAIHGPSRPLYYGIADDNIALCIGYEVSVPLGSRKTRGWIIDIHKPEDLSLSFPLKPLEPIAKAFDQELYKLLNWMARYYGSPMGEVLETAIVKQSAYRRKKTDPDDNYSLDNFAVDPKLTEDQKNATNKIIKSIRDFRAWLLYGVTGSGKTEVYIRVIREVLKNDQGAIVVVPEIALTPQILNRFSSRLGEEVAVLHSHMSKGQRWHAWESLLEGRVRVAIGARSAIFAPVQNLGIVIVDEEHDSSYKQSDNFRYHGRDIAVIRAKLANVPVVLGSATPSFESIFNAKNGKYSLIEMPRRIEGRSMPELQIVDMKNIQKKDMPSANISPQLLEALKNVISRGEQAMVLYNRRGFASYLQCTNCGEVLDCPNCSVSLTYHQKSQKILCHYCGWKESKPDFCPQCHDPHISRQEEDFNTSDQNSAGLLEQRGGGTEKAVAELQELFSQVKIARLDRDTTTRRGALKAILQNVQSGKSQILVGTQMIAKGHDIPNVTLAAVIDADVGLHMPDFRANETTWQLLTQIAGRAGRGRSPGKVIIQTRDPFHPVFLALEKNRTKAFIRYELDFREQLMYPPWRKMLRIIAANKNEQKAADCAAHVRLQIESALAKDKAKSSTIILGPAPAPLERINNFYRFHILIKSTSTAQLSYLSRFLHDLKKVDKRAAKSRLSIDLSPVSML